MFSFTDVSAFEDRKLYEIVITWQPINTTC